MFVRCSNSSSDILTAAHQNTRTVIDATQKETAIDQQQHSCEMLICQHHQTILRLLSSAATASTQWRVHELYCPTRYVTSVMWQHVSNSQIDLQAGGIKYIKGNCTIIIMFIIEISVIQICKHICCSPRQTL